MVEEQDFINHLEAEPRDYTVRYIYADWLDENDRPEDAARQRSYESADKWMDEFCKDRFHYYDDENRPITREDIIATAVAVIEVGGWSHLTQYGQEDLRDDYYGNEDRFLEVVYILTGRKVEKDDGFYPTVFSCSC